MRMIYKFIVCMFIVGFALPGSAQNQGKKFTLNDFCLNYTFRTQGITGLRSLNDGEHYTVLEDRGKKLVMYSYKTGKAVETLLDLNDPKYGDVKMIQDYEFSPDESHILIYTNIQPIYRRSFTADYYVFDFKNRELKPLSEGGSQRLATFSPVGTKIAFVRDNNIFISDLRFGSEIQITFDGKFNEIINGAPDWVYEEEFAFNKAFEWAPDGSALAFIKFDESNVKIFHMNMFQGQYPALKENATYPSNYSYKYPKAGEANSVVSVHVYDIKDRVTTPMNIGEETDIYIPRIKWTKDPKRLAIMKLNRFQNRLEILLANARVGSTTVLYREENKYYIAEENLDNLVFTEDGKNFIMSSEKNGYSHLYLYTMGGKEVQPITSGNYDVVDFYGYDPVKKLYYYSSHEESPLEKFVYSIDAKGKKKKLTPAKGWNEAEFSKSFKYFVNVVSNADMPPLYTLYTANGKAVRVLEDNAALKEKLGEYNVAKREYIQIPAADGKTLLNAWMMKPTDFDASKTYPVLIIQYSGPNSQQVRNSWGMDWAQYLAQEGYIVTCIDPRGTAARGEEFRKCTYMQLGKIESDDMIAAGKWLAEQPYIDARKVGIWGWSFGGFMSSLCLMKGNDVFSTAIAVAPVTHWGFYDSIYTERFMRRPQDNPSGYNDNSPINWVKNLKGNLLLCHGTADDNVHVQNAYELAEALVQANKQFDMQIYTNRNHSIYGGVTRLHLYTKFVDYLNQHLK
ncbi:MULTISPECIES: S9 family peptidase [Butyricimonas]|uniref:S9 family peptidase n=1 Tax=Butyricimonas TaxID=574697 RepID=UPI001D065191|nr:MULTISPECIES: S9 family peptidase [Butyricimonas]MCB6972431.1 S9 family peptidase [Butyricimonas synergistica]MCG4519439.1 S9 family peptidase [Butyricimonas sp. DFI.6.44]